MLRDVAQRRLAELHLLPVRLRDREVDDATLDMDVTAPNFDGYDDPSEFPPSYFDCRDEVTP
jgi:hypothetical protein